MIDRAHALPIKQQAGLVGISRGSVYYLPRPVSEADQRRMRRIDELPTASVVRFVATAERPPLWTTLQPLHIRRVPLIKLDSVVKRRGPALGASSNWPESVRPMS